jgi:predicted PhzF superfamily epimerase YddE/YHI9
MKPLARKSKAQLNDSLAKTETVVFRVSKAEKADMQATASKMGLSLTEYLTRLHQIAKGKL